MFEILFRFHTSKGIPLRKFERRAYKDKNVCTTACFKAILHNGLK